MKIVSSFYFDNNTKKKNSQFIKDQIFFIMIIKEQNFFFENKRTEFLVYPKWTNENLSYVIFFIINMNKIRREEYAWYLLLYTDGLYLSVFHSLSLIDIKVHLFGVAPIICFGVLAN